MVFIDRRESEDWMPPQRSDCSCPEHDDELTGLALPVTERGMEPLTVRDLVEASALGVTPAQSRDRWLEIYDETDSGPDLIGPFHWGLRLGDEARLCYDDDAARSLDQALLDRPGVERVEWMEREEFLVGAPGLCASGLLAAMARALADPRVRAAAGR
ncbi:MULTISPECIES: hypothetical protein [Micromonospora]|uniref:Uncharacterized protein n=1 Tax=Micromonospora sicca TaxID=2202420 RepID=A0A317DQW8_9ACTN|nr:MULTISPECIES: hypothetical protein [unclassified Micromonospora]MBM0227965.1 hypothetical protein [Micromonospora sp. ATA51]PWR16692.1 hypothetical protein DKT69_04215 [Micromonospora sp. 4G51]